MKTILPLIAATAITTTVTAQTPGEIESWDDLANGKEYVVTGPGIWSEEQKAYTFADKEYHLTISLDQAAENLTVCRLTETRTEQEQDGQPTFTIQTTRSNVTVLKVESNGAYLDYLGTLSGHHEMNFKSLEIVKYGQGTGLHDYNKNQMWILVLPAIKE